ncbi:probable ATP-dependent RNA helicase DHX58 isoform X1 [Phycodurus eques]|uniref:probable ATP-dependent RNA helicase DHX58 isoform X1 n=1 Tax=Phycodurus eques TaxID=693459 RepID=UPI002ACD3414|nr:probable ATP-dependent RNA helicase DHX58 isoform X1 [Phycodurus eques]
MDGWIIYLNTFLSFLTTFPLSVLSRRASPLKGRPPFRRRLPTGFYFHLISTDQCEQEVATHTQIAFVYPTCRDVRSGPARLPEGGGPEGASWGEHYRVAAHGSGEDKSRRLRGPEAPAEDDRGQSGGPGHQGAPGEAALQQGVLPLPGRRLHRDGGEQRQRGEGLPRDEETKHVDLSDITLLVVDECHHTRKETVYNNIMRLYLTKKMRGDGQLPQVLGLTASPGTGGAKNLEKAVQYILKICANLDCAIVSTKNFTEELNTKVPRPLKTFDIVEKRKEDPFGDHVQWMMRRIHRFMEPPVDFTHREFGTQEYENNVVTLQKRGVMEYNRRLQQCAIHLREYNDALLVNDTLQMENAVDSLEDFYSGRETTVIDDTDRFLVDLFKENQNKLRMLARDVLFENPKMAQLETTLLRHFSPNVQSRGILFSKTRKSTRCLHQWALANHGLHLAGVKPAVIMGSTAMTQHERDDAIRNFRLGSVNLLITTSVAEEGLDIPQCNLVVRYGLLTNEIAQQQASGRARAQDSHYCLIAQRGGREERRECINTYLEGLTASAVDRIQQMSPEECRTKTAELQEEAAASSREAAIHRSEKHSRYSADSVQLLCSNCLTPVMRGSDIQLVEKMHYVNVNPQFKSHYNKGDVVILDKTFEDWVPGCIIKCNKDNCNKRWGYEVKYRKVALLPNVAIRHFALQTPDGRTTVRKWKDVPFSVDHFSFSEYCRLHYRDVVD